jgi:hypothetical protein
MPWRVIKRRLGRAGSDAERTKRQREWDRQHGEGRWAIGYVVNGEFLLQEAAFESIYYRSYEEHFRRHPEDVEELVGLAKALRNPHAAATTSVDLQVPAIMQYLERHGFELRGSEVVDIGTWNGSASHAISIRLSPLHIQFVDDEKMTLEQFWQDRKCLAVWDDD